jgi:hypothetical protein
MTQCYVNESGDQEIEFHEIEIGDQNYLFAKLIMRLKLTFCKNDQEIEMFLGALRRQG